MPRPSHCLAVLTALVLLTAQAASAQGVPQEPPPQHPLVYRKQLVARLNRPGTRALVLEAGRLVGIVSTTDVTRALEEDVGGGMSLDRSLDGQSSIFAMRLAMSENVAVPLSAATTR